MILIIRLLYQICCSGVAQASNYRDVMYFYADGMGVARHCHHNNHRRHHLLTEHSSTAMQHM